MADPLPSAERVLAVVAHPDDESFGLGAVLATYAATGAEVGVVCLTTGEASTLGAESPELGRRRATEFLHACDALGVRSRWLHDHPDGRLAELPLARLVEDVRSAMQELDPQVVVVFHPGGVTGHPDHRRATEAACAAVDGTAVDLLAWYVPSEIARQLDERFGTRFDPVVPLDDDLLVEVDRTAQRAAVACHGSQGASLAIVEGRNALLGDVEHLRRLTGRE